jgi:hypothetical protein
MQQINNFLFHNFGIRSPEPISQKREWIHKWTKSEHHTFAEWFVAFTAATLIFNTGINSCAIDAFEMAKVLSGLVEGVCLTNKHTEVLEDFCNFMHNDLLIHTASPLSIHEIMHDAANYEFIYAKAIAPDDSGFLDSNLLIQNIKKNADKTLRFLGQPPYFHVPTV